MSTYPGSVTRITRRSGTSFARGTTIDEYLTPEENQELYKVWKSEWPEILRFHGGITAITCEMVLDVEEEEFLMAFGNTKKAKTLASNIIATAKQHAGR